MSTSLHCGLVQIERSLDNTALSAYMTCPREYYLAYHLNRRGGQEGPPGAGLQYGSLFHKVLEWYYKTGEESVAEHKARAWWAKHGVPIEGDHRTLERSILDFKRYREKWGATPLHEASKTVGFPDEPLVEIAAEVQAGSLIHPYTVKIDRVVDIAGLHYIQDHKTTARLDSNYFSGFEMSNQMKGYTRVGQYLMPQLRIVGVQINVIHVLKDKTDFRRELVTFTREELDEWESNTNEWARRLAQDIERWPSEDQILGDPKTPWPLAHFGDNGCSRKFGLCSYHRLCRIAAPLRRNMLAEIPVSIWNPLDSDE